VDLRIAGRKALVTGSSSGIGYAIAEALAREGAHVVLNGRSKKNLDAALAKLKKAVNGAACTAVVADASTSKGAQRITAAVPEVDILVNNLGKYERKGFFETTDGDWMDFYEFNVVSGIRFVRAYGQGMRKRNWMWGDGERGPARADQNRRHLQHVGRRIETNRQVRAQARAGVLLRGPLHVNYPALGRAPGGGGHGGLCLQRSRERYDRRHSAGRGRDRNGARLKIAPMWTVQQAGATG
jgi:NAD(P)-dependent dehydrogenase (short-subunit alcohol dehydrogenase family)